MIVYLSKGRYFRLFVLYTYTLNVL